MSRLGSPALGEVSRLLLEQGEQERLHRVDARLGRAALRPMARKGDVGWQAHAARPCTKLASGGYGPTSLTGATTRTSLRIIRSFDSADCLGLQQPNQPEL